MGAPISHNDDSIIDRISTEHVRQSEPTSQSMPTDAELLRRAKAELELLYAIEQQIASAHSLGELVRNVLASLVTPANVGAGFEAAALLYVDGEDAHVISLLRDRSLEQRSIPRTVAKRWLGRSRGTVCRQVSPEDSAKAQGLFFTLAFDQKRKVFEAPISGGDAHVGILQLVSTLTFSESDDVIQKRVSLVAAQLGRAVMWRRERDHLLRNERMLLLSQSVNAVLHDLRTPLTAVASSVEVMASAQETEVRRDYAERAVRNLEHVERMVQEILAFARGQREVAMDRLPLSRFVEEMRELLEPELRRFGAALEIHGDCEGSARFDASKIKRVLWSLARNAGEAGAKKFIWKVERSGEYVVFECSDTGHGIPREMDGKLFEPFASFGKPAGSGLGLAMAKSIIDAHCGRIHVKSELGNGTVFRIELPF
ncbi:MAG TPA: HAMP domain-containing sensor histidine kinase [Polyangiales bacterium]|nr:HAMP domain-containing sensor histidine kinase [Polyangiales bacterium]